MLHVRTLLLASAIAAGGCTAPQRHTDVQVQDSKALGERINRICALPGKERAVEIEKLKAESGMALYCGK